MKNALQTAGEMLVVCQTLGSELNGLDRDRDYLSRRSCAAGRSSPPSVDLDPRPFPRATAGGTALHGGLNAFATTAPGGDLPGADPDNKPISDGGRRSSAHVGRSPGSNKSVAAISTSGSTSGNDSSAMYDAATYSASEKQSLHTE